MLIDRAAVAAAERIRAQAGARVHRLGHPDELQEDAMPKKASTEPKVVKATKITDPIGEPKKRGRKPRDPNAAPAARKSKGPRFGVFDDGAVELRLPKCSGSLEATEARELVEFLGKLGVKA